jgi:hypothetical protein
MLAIFVFVLEMLGTVIRLVVCVKTMAERDCGWQKNYIDVVEAGINNNIV